MVMGAVAVFMIAVATCGCFLCSGFCGSCRIAHFLEGFDKFGVGRLLIIESDGDELVGKRCGDFLHTFLEAEIAP